MSLRRTLLAVLVVLCTSAVMAPSALADTFARTLPASDIHITKAKLWGEVGDRVNDPPPPTRGQWYFEYGKTNTYGSSTPVTDRPPGSSQPDLITTVSTTITNLEPNTTYNFRVVAISRGETAYGLNETFTTGSDSDGDGFFDNDQCPSQPGVANGYPGPGCPVSPDTDGDGFPADGPNSDQCPSEPGVAAGPRNFRGCPGPKDTDGDGYTDDQDPCPAAPGGAAGPYHYAGCPPPPNSDGDGLPDYTDRCPNQPGPDNTAGCPDADGDEDVDATDSCPTMPGPGSAAGRGCPSAGTPTIQTESVQITPKGVLFTASGNSAGQLTRVVFETSLTEGFSGRRGDLRPGPCYENDTDGPGRFSLNTSQDPGEAWYRDVQVTCQAADRQEGGELPYLDHILGWASRGKVYFRAVLFYHDGENQEREIRGRTLAFGGDGSAGSPYAREVRTLSTALAPKGKAAKIGQILKRNGFNARLTCPATGRMAVTWSLKVKGKSVVVATGAEQCDVGGGGEDDEENLDSRKIVSSRLEGEDGPEDIGRHIKIALTKRGKALLKKAKQAKLTTQTSFTPKGGKKVSANGTLTLKR